MFNVRFDVKRYDIGYVYSISLFIEAKDFEDAFYNAKNRKWDEGYYASISGIEEYEAQ